MSNILKQELSIVDFTDRGGINQTKMYRDVFAIRLFPYLQKAIESGALNNNEQMARVISEEVTDLPMLQDGGYTTASNPRLIIGSSYRIDSIIELNTPDSQLLRTRSKKVTDAINMHEKTHNELAFFGSSDGYSVEGFFNHSGMNSQTADLGAGGSTLWEQKTNDEIIDDVIGLMQRIDDAKIDENDVTDTLFLPTSVYWYLAKTPVSDDDKTSMLQKITGMLVEGGYLPGISSGDGLNTSYVANADSVKKMKALETSGTGGVSALILGRMASDAITYNMGDTILQLDNVNKGTWKEYPVISFSGGISLEKPELFQKLEEI